jgi:hypothetical protein
VDSDPDPYVFGPPGSESGYVRQRYESKDPDPYQNVTDPQHCLGLIRTADMYENYKENCYDRYCLSLERTDPETETGQITSKGANPNEGGERIQFARYLGCGIADYGALQNPGMIDPPKRCINGVQILENFKFKQQNIFLDSA